VVSATGSSEFLGIAGLKPRSLRGRMMLLLMLGIAAMWVVTASAMYREAHRSAERLLDEELERTARLLLALAEHELVEEKESPLELRAGVFGSAAQPFAYQLFDQERHLLARSALAPEKPMVEGAGGLADVQLNGSRWRVVAIRDQPGGLEVQMGETYAKRTQQGSRLALRLTLPFAVGFPLVAIFAWLLITRGLQPIAAVTQQVSGRAPHDLQPLTLAAAPREILPLMIEINRLFRRIEEALAGEKRFTGDAAHELRTPLAGLRAQAQLALRVTTPDEQNTALRHVIAGVDRVAHLIDQLLVLARLDPAGAPFEQELVELGPIAAAAVDELRETAAARHISIEQHLEPTEVIGNSGALGVMVRNLLDNAVRYTPEGGRVRLAIRPQGSAGLISVSDTGPGLTAEQRERVFDRFYRGRGTRQPGSGLGMSIVKRVAELHDATVELGDGIDGSGLGVTVRIPV
jgi:two-component system sensor histidine kinase QseC